MGWASVLKTGIKVVQVGARQGGRVLSAVGHGTVTAVKAAAPVAGKAITATAKTGVEAGKAVGKAALKNPLYAGAAWLYMKKEDGEGIIPAATRELLGESAVKKGGLSQGVKDMVFGDDNADKSLAENVTDLTLGEGTYQRGVNGASQLYQDARGLARQQGQPGSDMQQGQLLYDANGNVVGAYPGTGAYNPQQVAAMQSANPFSSMGSFVNQMSGGTITGLNAVEIMAAAYMMFGSRFGWLGKIAGALVGGTAAKDITNRSTMIQQQQQMSSGVQPAYQQPQYVPQYPQQTLQSQDEDYTVSRGRGL